MINGYDDEDGRDDAKGQKNDLRHRTRHKKQLLVGLRNVCESYAFLSIKTARHSYVIRLFTKSQFSM